MLCLSLLVYCQLLQADIWASAFSSVNKQCEKENSTKNWRILAQEFYGLVFKGWLPWTSKFQPFLWTVKPTWQSACCLEMEDEQPSTAAEGWIFLILRITCFPEMCVGVLFWWTWENHYLKKYYGDIFKLTISNHWINAFHFSMHLLLYRELRFIHMPIIQEKKIHLCHCTYPA